VLKVRTLNLKFN